MHPDEPEQQQPTPEVQWSEDFREMVRVLIREELAQQPSFPQSGIQIIPEGMRLSIALAPGTTITQDIGEDLMNQIAGKWLETRQQIKRHLRVPQ